MTTQKQGTFKSRGGESVMEDTYEEIGYDLSKEWDDDEAKYIYVLYQKYKIRGVIELTTLPLFGKPHTKSHYGEWTTGESVISSGGKTWAREIAKHYSLELPR